MSLSPTCWTSSRAPTARTSTHPSSSPVEPNSHGRKSVSYKCATLDLGDKQVKVYFHGDKNSPAQVALIFEGTKDALRNLSSQIDYSLNSLVTGPKATNFYNGQDELSDEGAAVPTGVF